ncbi:hypothetical protein [Bryobacter aggregatus]|uniref:hypothetical protein n=1 Tax=Bryobacter aggregatus TaxID=360054 RepID=UPI0004E160D2|nr:hypothetical protein [Bryobacter aggregatus]
MILMVALVWMLLLGGTVPLALLWKSASTRASRILLGAMTCSYLWCLVGIIFPLAIGPHYSDLRLGIINVNLWLSLAMAGAGLRVLHPKMLAIAVALWLPAAWIYIRTVSFVA